MFVQDFVTTTANVYCCCLSADARMQRKINQKIEHQLRREKRDARKNIKLLLLGTGESGKSTFIRQMRIIHEHGYESVQERTEYIAKIHQNIATAIYSIDHAMSMLGLSYQFPDRWHQVEHILKQHTNHRYVISWKDQFLGLDRNNCGADEPVMPSVEDPSGCALHIMCLQSYQSIVQLNEPLVPEQMDVIRRFWNDEGVQACLKRRNEFNLMDSSAYYMARLEDILSDSYVPTVQDILRVRIPTNGINEYTFGVESVNFLILDVGGQRTERRKWIHCFENVASIIFLVALNEFDQVLSEPLFPVYLTWRPKPENQSTQSQTNTSSSPNNDSSDSPNRAADHLHRQMSTLSGTVPVNRLEESKALFKTIITSEWFRNSSMILFLNKYDIFEDKITYGPNRLVDYFPGYLGPEREPTCAAEYILEMFYQTVDPMVLRKRVVYSHFTCATDTRNIKLVFQAVKDTILEQMLCKEIQIF